MWREISLSECYQCTYYCSRPWIYFAESVAQDQSVRMLSSHILLFPTMDLFCGEYGPGSVCQNAIKPYTCCSRPWIYFAESMAQDQSVRMLLSHILLFPTMDLFCGQCGARSVYKDVIRPYTAVLGQWFILRRVWRKISLSGCYQPLYLYSQKTFILQRVWSKIRLHVRAVWSCSALSAALSLIPVIINPSNFS